MKLDSAVDRVDVTLLVENSVDILLPNEPGVRRVGLYEHFKPEPQTMLSENGVAFLVDTVKSGRHHVVLFDTGLSGVALLNNMRKLNRSPDEITHVVISHGHPDHYGGLRALLTARTQPVPIAIHPAAFHARYIHSADGNVIPAYNYGLINGELERMGAYWVVSEEPILVAAGVTTTGYIPPAVPFEPPAAEPGKGSSLFMIEDGKLVQDQTPDDQALCINVAGAGLVVLTGCAHAGVISSVMKGLESTSADKLYAVMGGFHLGFPGVSEERAELTVEQLKVLKPARICPMHCTGLHAMSLFYTQMRSQFIRVSTGMTVSIEA